jgi:hypothetical protein
VALLVETRKSGRIDTTKLIVAFENSANALKQKLVCYKKKIGIQHSVNTNKVEANVCFMCSAVSLNVETRTVIVERGSERATLDNAVPMFPKSFLLPLKDTF